MFAKVSSIALVGLQAFPVEVEINLESQALPEFHVVGLPSAGVREARQRVRAAVINSPGRSWPDRRIVANLAPADLRKEGALLDLPIAIGVLAASEEFRDEGLRPEALGRHLFVGELALDGTLRPMRGAVAAALTARNLGIPSIILPLENASEAALVPGVRAQGAASLNEAVAIACGRINHPATPPRLEELLARAAAGGPDLAEVQGQALARRALEIAAAGGHNLLLVGPPGSGKTMLARRLPGILPPLTVDQALEVTHVWSVAGLLSSVEPVVAARPFRAPHHHASAASIIGGGSPVPRPGEVSLSHHGVLFLDEIPLFSVSVLDGLRQPLEDGAVTVARQAGTVRFPAGGSLVAAANSCLCTSQDPRDCSCSPGRLHAYRARLSGPLLDRIDLQVEVPALTEDELLEVGASEGSAAVRARVVAARRAQCSRAEGLNSALPKALIEEACELDAGTRAFLRQAVGRQSTSGRAYHRLLRVARTIADLDGAGVVGEAQVAEALLFRRMVWEA